MSETASGLMPSAFTHNALSLIAARLESARTPEDFLAEVDAIAGTPQFVLSVHGMAAFARALDVADDGANSQTVHETLGGMDRSNAADPRLWTYLALVTQREFMMRRWSLNPEGNWKGRVVDRWLMQRPTRRALVRNGVARLWWIAELTCDARLERPMSAVAGDPYAYTKWVFGNEDRVPAIFERELGASPAVMWAVIEALQASAATNQSAEVRRLAKEVRVNAGFRSLESLDEARLMALTRTIASGAESHRAEDGAHQ